MTDLLAAALEYAAAGIHVFPARVAIVDGKKDVAPVGEWRKASTTNAAEIRDWFAPDQKWATASLCIDCGKSGIVVVDPDEGDGKGGLANWAAVRAEHNVELAPRAATPGGGEHWYYREHPRHIVGNDSTGKVAKDVDVRGLGGFVLAWPSTDTRGAYGRVDLDALTEAPIVPDLVIERMTAKAAAPATAAPDAVPVASAELTDFWAEFAAPREFTKDQAKEFCVPPLESFRAMRTPEDRGFNQRLNEVACVWSHFVPAFMTLAQAEAELYQAAKDNRSVEFQGEAGVQATIRSGLSQQTDPWRAVRVEEAPLAAVDTVMDRFPRLDWAALWADESTEDWIVEPLLPARRLVALYSPPKLGKSLLMLELAVGVARGTDILGVTPDRPRRVLYVDFENDPKGDIRERLMAMGFGPEDLENLVYLSFPVMAALDSAAGGAELMAVVETYGCEVVVIDTVSRAIQGEENENDTWLAFYRHTGKALKAAGVALIRLDHTGKDETKGQRGGSAKSGDVDAVWRMSEIVRDKTYRLECEANRMPVLEKTLVIHRETTPRLRHRVDAEGRWAAWRIKVEEITKAVDAAGIPRDAGRVLLRAAVTSLGLKASDHVLGEVARQRKGDS